MRSKSYEPRKAKMSYNLEQREYYSVNHIILTNCVLLGNFGIIYWSLLDLSTLYLEGTRTSLIGGEKKTKKFEQ
jgi:hypothetical protein